MANIMYRQKGVDEYYQVWHTSNVNLIIYMHSTGGSIVCSEMTLPIKKGALCFIGSGKYHYTMPDDPEIYERSKIFFLNEEMNALLSVLSNKEGLRKKFAYDSIVYAELCEEEQKSVEKMLDDIQTHSETKHNEAVLFSTLLRLFVSIDENQKERISFEAGPIMSAIEYINSHISEEIKIDDVCEVIHLSKYHFCREFKRMTGQTPMEYVLRTRIVLAKNMLSKKGKSIQSISEACGFRSASYFCRAFKEECKVTPLEFRRNCEKT